jgi:outer membrane protein insertion porin family
MRKLIPLAALLLAATFSVFGQGDSAPDEPATTAPNAPVVEPKPAGDKEDKTFVTTPEQEARTEELGPVVKQVEIRFAGPQTTNESVIRANIRTKEGERFAQSQSDEDVRQLYATGFFSNVRIYTEPLDDGVKVVVLVQGKSKIKDIKIKGNNEFSESKLLKQVKSKAGDTLSERQVAEDANAILEFYEKEGFQKVTVNFEVTPDELTGRSILTFVVNEGKQIKIEEINFEGNENVEASKLRKQMQTKTYFWLLSWITKKGYLREDVFEDDKHRIIDYYKSLGYIDADIKDVKFDYPGTDVMTITIFVYEGKQYKVGDVKITGNKLYETPVLDKELKMKGGSTFTPGGLQDDIKAVKDYYGARGYIDTRVTAVRTPNVTSGMMDITYEISEGDLVYIDKIEVSGNIKTKDKVIRREIAVKPGEIYNAVKVDASKQRLENLGYFSRVNTYSEATDVANRRNLLISVEEQRTGEVSFGVGFSSVDSLLGFVELKQGNFDIMNPPYFTGAGQKFRVRAQYGLQRQDYIMSFTEPWFMNEQLAVGGDLFYSEANFLSNFYNERRYGGDVRVSRALDQFMAVDLMYKYEIIDIFDLASNASQTLQAEQGRRSKSSLFLAFTRDERDSVFLPTKGYKLVVFTEVAGGPLGGQTDLYKFGVSAQKFFLMPWEEKHILSFNFAATTVNNFGDSNRVPIFDRLFLGGAYDLRGYNYRDISPEDNQGEPIGGKTSSFLQTEYSFPVIDRVRFAVFHDIGFVAPGSWSVRTNENAMFSDAGVGLRLNLPIGPINLDFGVPIITNSANESTGKFNFSAGYQF